MPTLKELIDAQKALQAASTPVPSAAVQSSIPPSPIPTNGSSPGPGSIVLNLKGFAGLKNLRVAGDPAQAIPVVATPDGNQSGASASSSLGTVPLSLETTAPPDTTDELKNFNHSQMGEGFTEDDIQGFKDALAVLHSVFDNPEMVMNASKNILRGLKDNPMFVKFLQPEDCGLMVRALRESTGIVASSKIAGKEKRASKSKSVDDLAAEIGELL